MRWVAAEQLLADEPGEDSDHPGPSSMLTFADDEERCRCSICQPNLAARLANRRKRNAAHGVLPTRPASDLIDVLTMLRPNLIRTARRQLQTHGQDVQLAEDLVQEAIARWLTRRPEYRSQPQLYAWLRSVIARFVSDLARRRPDLLDARLLSLDEPWARG